MKFKQLMLEGGIDAVTADKVIRIMTEALEEGHSIGILNFGTFQLVKANEREIYIPGTKKKVKVLAKTKVRFKPAKALKERVAKGNK